MEAFWLSVFLIFVAEMGDKTQLVALTLATRFNAWVVLAGVFVATLLVHAFSVLFGGAAHRQTAAAGLDWLGLRSGLRGLWPLDPARAIRPTDWQRPPQPAEITLYDRGRHLLFGGIG